MSKTNKTRDELFTEKVWPEPNSGCWLWGGAINTNGYGNFRIEQRKSMLAHRYAWRLRHGRVPTLDVLHKCDNRLCVNPDHLFLGTQTDNNADMMAKGRNGVGSRQGVSNSRARLTESAVLAIRSSDLKFRTLAEHYGVSETTISNIKSGKRWSHVK